MREMLYPYVTSMFDPNSQDEATYYYHATGNKSRQVALYVTFEKNPETGKYTKNVDVAICYTKFGSEDLIDVVTGEEYIYLEHPTDYKISEKAEKKLSKRNAKFNGSVRCAVKYTIFNSIDLNKNMGVASSNNPFGENNFPRKQLNAEVYRFEKEGIKEYCGVHTDLNGNPIYYNFGQSENNFEVKNQKVRKRVETV